MAVRDIHMAAPMILETTEAVMDFGGYYGRDEALSAEEFARMVSSGQVHYVLLTRPRNMGQMASPSQGFPLLKGIEGG